MSISALSLSLQNLVNIDPIKGTRSICSSFLDSGSTFHSHLLHSQISHTEGEKKIYHVIIAQCFYCCLPLPLSICFFIESHISGPRILPNIPDMK